MVSVKKISLIILVIVLLLLDYTALDDITTGNEPSFVGEYLFHTLASIIFGYLIGLRLSHSFYDLQNQIRKRLHITKVRIHHNLGGLVLVVVGIFLSPLWLQILIIGVGVGLITHHLRHEGFVLISGSKEKVRG